MIPSKFFGREDNAIQKSVSFASLHAYKKYTNFKALIVNNPPLIEAGA